MSDLYKTEQIACDNMRGIICNKHISIIDKERIMFDIYKILDNKEVDIKLLPMSAQYYAIKFRSLENKTHIVQYYTRLINMFKIHIKPTNKEKELNKAIDNCIKKIEEYNNNKSKQLNVDNSTSSNDSNITQQHSDTITMYV